MKKLFKNIGLPVIIFLIFFVLLCAQAITGFKDCNHEITEQYGKSFTFAEYLTSGHFLEATFENWESKFLQMGIFVWFAFVLFRHGPSDLKHPDKNEDVGIEIILKSNLLKRNGWRMLRYQNSLSIAFFFLFLLFFILHFYGSLLNYNNEQILKGKPVENTVQYIGNNRFWFESFKNWQSEFLSVFCIVLVFNIFSRQKGFPQLKQVDAADSKNCN